jgi:hypothetical protein
VLAPLRGQQRTQAVDVALADEHDPGRADDARDDVLLLGDGDRRVGLPAAPEHPQCGRGGTRLALDLAERGLLGTSTEHDQHPERAEQHTEGDGEPQRLEQQQGHREAGQAGEQEDAKQDQADPAIGLLGHRVALPDLLDPTGLLGILRLLGLLGHRVPLPVSTRVRERGSV